ncbi:MAG: integrin alpha [Rhodanobacteraceae bacterium]
MHRASMVYHRCLNVAAILALACFSTFTACAHAGAAAIQLGNLNGSNGFRLDGESAGDDSGFSVAGAGDINGDGIDDVVIGAARSDSNGFESGSSYVVFGRADDFAASVELVALDGHNGFRLTGATAFEESGHSVAGAGDINGDGIDDLVIGAPFADSNGAMSGTSYVVFGRRDGFPASVDLGTLDGNDGFRLDGTSGRYFSGGSVAGAGDINGDGVDDLVIGATYPVVKGDYPGSSYVVFGRTSGFPAILDLGTLDGTDGFRLDGVKAGAQSGYPVAAAGDLNADGIDDLVIGAYLASPNGYASGSSYVVFGHGGAFAGNVSLSALDGHGGFRIDGIAANEFSGLSVSGAGDINGDGIDDLMIGASGDGAFAGSSYVLFGHSGDFPVSLRLDAFDGSNGFRLDGLAPVDYSGSSVADADDINGDGLDDLLIGASGADPNGSGSGSSYVFFGHLGKFPASLSLGTLDGNNGFRLDGVAAGDSSGYSVAHAGDVNGDGIDDLVIGAPFASPNGGATGSAYVVFGHHDRVFCDGFDGGACLSRAH